MIGIQCIIFGWFYGLDYFVPVLNENGIFKVGKVWKTIIKYILPLFLFIIWTLGIIELFSTAKFFELIIDIIVIVAVLLISYLLTRTKTRG